MNKSGIYIIKNSINPKVYIGSAINFRIRFNEHKCRLFANKHHSSLLQRFVNKYGFDSLIFEVIEICSKDSLLEREQYWLDFYRSYDKTKGFNLCQFAGKSFGRVTSEVTKRKQSEAAKGRMRSAESISKQKEALKGFKHTEEARLKISQAGKARKMSPEAIAKRQKSRYENGGYVVSEQTRIKSSIAHKGIKRSKEANEKIVAARRGIPLSEEHKRKVSEGIIRYYKLKKQHETNIVSPD